MGLFVQKLITVDSPIDLSDGVFAQLENRYVLPTRPIKAGTIMNLEPLPVSCMFRVYKAVVDQEVVGYGFSSAFYVENRGGYLLTRAERITRPTSFSVVLRLPELVLCDFANAGALAISPKINDAVANIFMEQ